ncbi:galectin-9 [Bombina bombina]|uniref:galectin-9 n=1 Tax=Bombina bombina TaxID=8345 RepID=UPI00235A7543|nr:galectin-9 [Bombina bombina]
MSYGEPPVYNPPVPFTKHFHNGLQDGAMVVISGAVLHSGDRFVVNFQCGPSSSDDIAFHFNPRFADGGIVVCNTKERQSWGQEQNKREMPFHRGQPFEIRILVKSHAYMVSVNRNHFLEYHHKIPLHRVNTVVVDGCISLTSMEVQGQGGGFPSQQFPSGTMFNPGFPQQPGFAPQQFPPGAGYPNQFPSAPFQMANFAVPYQALIPGGMFPSKTIIVRGAVTSNPKRFHINFKYSGGTVFHFNPRFDEKVIVRNSKLNNSWGKEERQLPGCGMMFAPGQSFVIEITSEHHAFKVKVNGHHMFDFHHRMNNLQQIDTLQIEGDIVLQHVQF